MVMSMTIIIGMSGEEKQQQQQREQDSDPDRDQERERNFLVHVILNSSIMYWFAQWFTFTHSPTLL